MKNETEETEDETEEKSLCCRKNVETQGKTYDGNFRVCACV